MIKLTELTTDSADYRMFNVGPELIMVSFDPDAGGVILKSIDDDSGNMELHNDKEYVLDSTFKCIMFTVDQNTGNYIEIFRSR